MLDRVLTLNPWIEVLVKWLYWKFAGLRTSLKPLLKKIRRTHINQLDGVQDFEELKKLLKEFDIKKDEILLVHSSFTDLHLDSVSPKQLLDFLIEEIVPDGTLVLPAMPIMKDIYGKISSFPGDPNSILVFDLRKSPPWTGLLPRKMMQYPGCIRWLNPLNNVIALGRHSSEMMAGNLFDKNLVEIYPSGVESPWHYMVKNNAKILSLGTDMVHSLTMIHYVEDIKGLAWPIKNWYRKRKFIICNDGIKSELILNERDPKWAINFAERTLRKDLLDAGILKSERFNGAKVEFLETDKVVNFLNKRNACGYPYFTLSKKK